MKHISLTPTSDVWRERERESERERERERVRDGDRESGRGGKTLFIIGFSSSRSRRVYFAGCIHKGNGGTIIILLCFLFRPILAF